MAASFVPVSSTLEQQTFETLNRARRAAADYAIANPNADTGLSIDSSIDTSDNTATFTVILPLTQSVDADGGLSFDATSVLV